MILTHKNLEFALHSAWHPSATKLILISRMPKHKNHFLWFAAQNIIARLLGSTMWLVEIHHSLSRHTQTGLLRILV